jgi:Zn-dependent protease
VFKLLALIFGGLKFGKILLSVGSMLLMIGGYGFEFGWPFAVGFVLLLAIHEAGHYLAARQRGLNVGLPTFIPFVGAWIQLKELPHDVETEAYVGIAGPVAGSLGALACYYAGRYTGEVFLLSLAYTGFFLNLFNLIPLSPFDGGRITAAISPKLWLVGVPILVAAFFYQPSPILILIAVLAVPHVLAVLRGQIDTASAYYAIPLEKRVEYGLAYIGLVVFLASMLHGLGAELHRS